MATIATGAAAHLKHRAAWLAAIAVAGLWMLVGRALPESATSPELKPPLGLPPLPPGALGSLDMVELGQRLFLDRGLSFNGALSCAMCHIPEQAFTSNQTATSVGFEGKSLRRNAPTLLNVIYRKRLFHDGREPYLAAQPWSVLLNPIEMANPSIGAVIERLSGNVEYRAAFQQAFPGVGITMETIGRALASYEAILLTGNTRFDRWLFGKDPQALSEAEVRGFRLFQGPGGCASCHTISQSYALFADGEAHNTGIGYANTQHLHPDLVSVELAPGVITVIPRSSLSSVSDPVENDLGRFEITLRPEDRWAYMTPTLRAIARTAPYMHDGSLTSLESVIDFYDRGGIDNPQKDPMLRPLGLSQQDKADLVAFLRVL